MPLISLDGASIAYGADLILSGVTLGIEPRERVAVVGANGSGKTSLLELISGNLVPRDGLVDRLRGLRTAHLPQDVPEPVADTVLDEVLASRADLVAMHGELTELEGRMQCASPELESLLSRYGDVQHRYQVAGGYEIEARAREALGGLGMDAELQRRHPRSLSGGQQRRVELAKLLLADADLLLIDEPTNHLDLTSIEWLEEFMAGVSAAFVLVSHDRRFLDRVCTSVLELSDGTVEQYPGNYTQFMRLRGERRARRQKEFEAQQAHVAHQEDFIRRYKAGQRAREARGRQKQLDRLPRVAAPALDRRPRLRFAAAPGSRLLLRTGELEVGRDRVLLRTPPISIGPGERIAIVGANGSGKSTLLHTLSGDLTPLRGSVTLGPRTCRRLYRQDLGRGLMDGQAGGDGDGALTVLDDLLLDHPVGPERARTVLGSLLFTGHEVHKLVADLSGGELARLLLGKLALEQTNLLLLDEPTNHLDIPAQEVLERALQVYEGAVVLVTHDRALIDAVATRTWALEEGRVREVLGGYSDLLRARDRERRRAQSTGHQQTEPARQASHPARRRGRTPRQGEGRDNGGVPALRRLEEEIAQIEAQLKVVRNRLLDPATFSSVEQGAEAGREHDRLNSDLAALYREWEGAAGTAG